MRILLSVRNPSYVRYYDSVLRMLAARGHEIEVVSEHAGDAWPPSVLALATDCPGLHLSHAPSLRGNPWWELATRLRQARFYLRFLDPEYRGMPGLLERARERAPIPAIRIAEFPGVGRGGRALLARVLDALDQCTRTAESFHEYLRERRPDVIVLSPLVILKTTQLEQARAAIELGIRNVFAVASWDHLSSKGELTFEPQRAIVWNEVQKREMVDLHGIDPATVAVTGSQVFDDWFNRHPSSAREAFCLKVGLPADRPIVLYACSALLEGSPPESDFVLRWVRHLRHSTHPVLRDCAILIRPHFKRGDEWQAVDFSGLGEVACWPRAGDVPVDARSKTDYFDSLFHATAVVGLNTSAMIEAAIVGKPVHTVLLPEFRDSQEGTVHFHYLLNGPNAVLRASRSLEDHERQLADVLEGRDTDADRSARFVRHFVRPGAPDVSATVRFVETLETLGASPAPLPRPAPAWTRAGRPFLQPFARAAAERIRRISEERRRKKEVILAEHRKKRREERDLARQTQETP
ncbi:MAG: hypothetical protein HOP16_12750 [Acidobacteria bacterium]|nr:hypothetical protein [Acidobacteriota bacterium]